MEAEEGPSLYSHETAELYDADIATPDDADACIDALASLAGGGPALELGVGTGRVAVPLADRGVRVFGIDSSPAMLERLRGRPGGDRVTTVHGDFTELALEERFALVFVVFDTITALPSQDAPVRCFDAVARHLRPGGVFVVEASVPGRVPHMDGTGGHSLVVKSMEPERVQLEANFHDPAEQRIYTQWIVLRSGSVRLFPFEIRYAWPSELDLMARLSGLRLRERWGGWQREPFAGGSEKRSVYEAGAERR